MTSPIGADSSHRVNLVGYVSGNLGLGVAARAVGKAMLARGFEVAVLDLDSGNGHARLAIDPAFTVVSGPDEFVPGINLVVLPPMSVVQLLAQHGALSQLLLREDCLNALFTFWELPTLPPSWGRALELFDAVVAPSGFIAGTLDSVLSGTPVVRGLTPLELPSGIEADRARFGFPKGVFVAVSSFDPLSDPERKNPQGAIDAFHLAFGDSDSARLVVKLNVPAGGYADEVRNRTVLQPLLRRLRADKRTLVIAESLSYRDVLSLYASADAFISLHRAEGLGLGLLESMALGKPVVATGWSGNKVFMSPANACMVRHTLVPVEATHMAYVGAMKGLEPLWAQPDIDDAALWLQRLASDSALRLSIGSAATSAYLRYQTEATALGFLDDLMALRRHQQANPRAASVMSRRTRIQEVRHTLQRAGLGPAGRLGLQLRDQFDRHIAWRLVARSATK